MYKKLSTKSSPRLLLSFLFGMLVLNILLSTTITSSLMFENYVLLSCVMLHGIILKYYRSCMDINLKTTSRLEEKIDMILCLLLIHKTIRTLQYYLMVQAVVVSGIFQIIHKHRPLYTLVIHCTLSIN